MAAIAVELKIECRYCGQSIPINALSPFFICKNCLNKITISNSSWKEFLGEICRRVLEENDNRLTVTGNIIPFYVEGHQAFRLYGKEEPKFKKQIIPIENLKENSQLEEFEFLGSKILIREVPKNYISFLKGVKYLVGEDINQIPINNQLPIKNEESKLIVFTCPSCGGTLKVDGKNRIIHCEFCDSSIFIPDALWLQFHPASVTKRWYLYYGENFPSK